MEAAARQVGIASGSGGKQVRAFELGSVASVDTLWTRGGLPESLLAASAADSLAWRRDFLRSYLERDIPMFAPRLPAETIGRPWGMLVHGQGNLLNQSRLASSLAVSSPVVWRHIDLLVDLLLVRRLRPWSGNVGKRLVRSPKVYVRDSGLTHGLLELESWEDVLGHPVAGPSWEGFVIENLIGAADSRRASSRLTTTIALTGAAISFAPTWNATFRTWVSPSPLRQWKGCGCCLPIATEKA